MPRRNCIATTDYGAAVCIPELARALHTQAPGVSLALSAWNSATLDDLEEGRIDCALYTDEALPPGFHHAPLFEEDFAFLLRANHPVLASRDKAGHLSPQLLAALPRVVLTYPDGNGMGVDDPLSEFDRTEGSRDLGPPTSCPLP